MRHSNKLAGLMGIELCGGGALCWLELILTRSGVGANDGELVSSQPGTRKRLQSCTSPGLGVKCGACGPHKSAPTLAWRTDGVSALPLWAPSGQPGNSSWAVGLTGSLSAWPDKASQTTVPGQDQYSLLERRVADSLVV